MPISKSKFVSAFGSMQMLGSNYVDDDDEDEDDEPKPVSISHKPNEEDFTNDDFDTLFPGEDPPKKHTEKSLDKDAAEHKPDTDSSLANGDELYNPLEGLEVDSDNDNKMVISNSPDVTNVNVNETLNLSKIAEDSSSRSEPSVNENGDGNVKDISEENLTDTKSEKHEEHEFHESSKKDESALDDHDELLGTALAELEQEEKEKQLELEKIISQEKERSPESKKSKKKKKDKLKDKVDKDTEKESKKKKKKKKKKKAKNKDSDGKKKKKSRKYTDDLEGLGIDELLERIKEEEKKMESKKHKKKDKKHDKKPSDRKPSPDEKDEAKREKKKSKHLKHRRSPSPERKSHKHSSSPDRKRKYTPSSDSKKEGSGSVERARQRPSSVETNNRKRLSKDLSPDHNKRKRIDPSPDRYRRRSYDVKKRSCEHSPVEEDNRKRNHNSVHRNDVEKLNYEIKLPERIPAKAKTVVPPLSKEEFYELQNKVRKIDSKVENVQIDKKRTDSTSSSSLSSDSDDDIEKTKTKLSVEKALHRSTFTDNYSAELDKIRQEHKVELTSHVDNHMQRERRLSESSSRHKSHSPKSDKQHFDKLAHFTEQRRRSISENNDVHKAFDFNPHVSLSEDEGSLTINIASEDSQPDITHITHLHTKLFDSSKSPDVKDNSLVTQPSEVISSQSDTEGSIEILSEKPRKEGSLSLRQYKERRARRPSDHKKRDSHDLRGSPVSSQGDSLHNHSNKENEPRVRQENEPRVRQYQHRRSFSDDVDMTIERMEKNCIPLLDDREEKAISQSSFDAEAESIFQAKDEGSPYNPEQASPFDMASPSDAAIEDRTNVNFDAYKDVTAFEDIMKSKVKHEARKHKRRKLEELKEKFGSPEAGTKEGKLVDYLVRQAQVEEEMKSVLKTFFKNNEITKDEYKNILKKAVPQVTMSNSPIVSDKIESLMMKFVRKCKGQRAADERHRRKEQQHLSDQQKHLQQQLQSSAAMFQQIRVLNPHLPMPPV